MADMFRRIDEDNGAYRHPDLQISTSRSSDAGDAPTAVSTRPPRGPADIKRLAVARTSPSTAAANSNTINTTISRCSSTDSRDSHLSSFTNASTFTNMSSNLAAEWRKICTVSSKDRLDQPLSPSILTSPECVRDRTQMDGAVSNTLEGVAQLHSFLSEVAAASSNNSASLSSSAGIRRVGSKGEDSVTDSVGQESTRSDDSLRREESQLCGAAEAMKREMEGLDRLLSMRISAASSSAGPIEECLSSTLSNDEEDGIVDGEERLLNVDESLNYSLDESREYIPMPMPPMTGTPSRKNNNVKSNTNIFPSPSGAAEFCDNADHCDEGSESSYSARPFRSVSHSHSLHDKLFDSAASVGSGRSDASSCRLAAPQQLVPRGWVGSLAELAFGAHEYNVKTAISKKHQKQQLQTRTVEGGLFVTASVAVALSVLLRTGDLARAVSVQQFYAAMAIIPPLVTLFEAKIVPHQVDETKIALSVLLGGMMLERVMG